MQPKRTINNYKQLDSYSAMICSKYFKTSKDYINLICVNSKFKETTEKFRYNPIPIKNLKLFPRIQTQHLYGDSIKMLKYKQITKYEFWGEHNYLQYTKLKKKSNIKWHGIEYTRLNRVRFGDKIPDEVTTLGCNCFGSGGGYYPNTSSASLITIPTQIKFLPWFCFSFCQYLESVNLPSTLTQIYGSCFYKCYALTSINLPLSLESLGGGCFEHCTSLPTINFPSKLTSISDGCFSYCKSLNNIEIPTTIKSLGKNCFYACTSLKNFNLPTAITFFGEGCFGKCGIRRLKLGLPENCY